MAESDPGTETHYDRDFLLSPGKRNQVMALWEVEKFGTDSFGDPDYVSIYGMRPAEWHGRGVRLLARTTLEAVRDQLGAAIGQEERSQVRVPGRRKGLLESGEPGLDLVANGVGLGEHSRSPATAS